MLEKVAAFAKTKAAVALLGVAVVGGGGGAVAVAATTGHLSTMGVNLNSSDDANKGDHTSVEGLLTGCTTSTVSVKDSDGKSWTFNVTSSTKFNGDVKSGTNGASSAGSEATEVAGASTSKGNESDHAGSSTGDHSGASTSKGSESDHAGSSTGSSSTHAGSSTSNDSKGDTESHEVTLAQVCAAANINTRDVQVQATKTSSGYDARKVTLQGPGSAKNDSSTGDSSKSDGGSSSEGGSSTDASTAKP